MQQPGTTARALPGIHVSRAPWRPVPVHVAPYPTRSAAGDDGRRPAAVSVATPSRPTCFEAAERSQLLLATRIGPKLVEHLERAGFTSIAQMRALGARHVLARVSEAIGLPNCANRARALERAIRQRP